MSFEAKRIQRTDQFILEAAPEKVFPFLCPKRELEWIPGWEYEMVYSESGYNEEGCIFKALRPFGLEMTWICDQYDPENWIIRFVNIAPGMVVIQFRIRLTKTARGTSAVVLEQVSTGLSEAGNQIITELDQESKGKPCLIEQMLGYYLKTGQMLQEK